MTVDPTELFSTLIRYETELWDAVEARLRDVHRLDLSWFEPMQVIHRTPACRVHDIAAALSITVGGTSKLVDRIEAAGWCERRPNPEDSRSSLIALTAAGRRVLAAATRTFTKEVEGHFGSVLTPRALRQFATTLQQLRDALRSGSVPPVVGAPVRGATRSASIRADRHREGGVRRLTGIHGRRST